MRQHGLDFFFLRGRLLISKSWVQFLWTITLLIYLGYAGDKFLPLLSGLHPELQNASWDL